MEIQYAGGCCNVTFSLTVTREVVAPMGAEVSEQEVVTCPVVDSRVLAIYQFLFNKFFLSNF